ncbi:unnamed protein product [Moneuplotes crassus]|uniref:Uncharacterized protein n=1 Tax=Euplotes crassus TaxID=5936 RepID=A0AAD2D2A3_EUPCR|nr:unnamed protein product [Moneuplotes crassus]
MSQEGYIHSQVTDLDTAVIGEELYPTPSKKRELKNHRKILKLQEKFNTLTSDYLCIKEDNHYLRMEAKFWKNKVGELLAMQKVYLLENIADAEMKKIAPGRTGQYGQVRDNRKKNKDFQKSVEILRQKELKEIKQKQNLFRAREIRLSQPDRPIKSIFKAPNSIRKSPSKHRVRFREEDIEDSENEKNDSKSSKIIPNPTFLITKAKRPVTRARIKSRSPTKAAPVTKKIPNPVLPKISKPKVVDLPQKATVSTSKMSSLRPKTQNLPPKDA